MADSDATIRRRPGKPPARKRWRAGLLGVAVLLLLAGGAAWWGPAWLSRHAPSGVPASRPVGELADEATILAARPAKLTIFRFASNPRVLVLDFPDLAAQGRMLNRVAALVEKAGLPRDRVLNDTELAAAIAASGATPATYYYGHDYRAADVLRFFALADKDRIALNADEQRLRALARAAGWNTADPVGALISLPSGAAGNPDLDASARATILRHELSHGEYFTNPAYAAYVRGFWIDQMDASDRALFRRMLAAEDYDQGNEDLMINEMQAHLMHTADPRFFNAAALGMSQTRLDDLRARFVAGMPVGWLRDVDTKAPARAPRQGAVSRGRAVPVRRPPRARRASMAAPSARK